MRSLLKIFFFVLIQINANACVISPFDSTISNAEQLFDESDIVFWGRLDSELVNAVDREQLAEFTIIKSYKGEISGKITIVNELSNSCSRVFEMPMTTYYVYAMKDDEGGKYRISGHATFVPLEYSIEHEWEPKL